MGLEDDGFTMVANSRSRARHTGGRVVEPGAAVGEQPRTGSAPAAASNSMDEHAGVDIVQGDARPPAGQDGGADDDATELQEQAAPSVDQLRALLDREQQVVAMLEKDGRDEDDPVLDAARRQVQQARARLAEVRGPRPHHVSLRYATEKLNRAIRAQEKAETELEAFDAQYWSQRQELARTLSEARDRVELRQAEVDDIRRQVGAVVGGSGRTGGSRVSRLAHVCGNDVGPAMAAIAEGLDTGSEAYRQLQALQGRLRDALAADTDKDATDDYFIGDYDSDELSELDSAEEDMPMADDTRQRPAPAQGGHDRGQPNGGVPATTAARANSDVDSAPTTGAAAWTQEGELWRRAQAGDSQEGDASAEPPRRKSRLGQTSEESDAEKAKQLLEQQARVASLAPGSQEMAAEAERIHAARLGEIIQRARQRKVEFNEGELRGMSAEALEAWAHQHSM